MFLEILKSTNICLYKLDNRAPVPPRTFVRCGRGGGRRENAEPAPVGRGRQQRRGRRSPRVGRIASVHGRQLRCTQYKSYQSVAEEKVAFVSNASKSWLSPKKGTCELSGITLNTNYFRRV